MTSSPAYRGGGFLSQKSEPSVLVRSHYCTKHKRAIPVCPTVLCVSYAFTSRIPSFRILMAALISLSCCVPHAGHSHARILRFFVSAFWYPQQEQIWLLVCNTSDIAVPSHCCLCTARAWKNPAPKMFEAPVPVLGFHTQTRDLRNTLRPMSDWPLRISVYNPMESVGAVLVLPVRS